MAKTSIEWTEYSWNPVTGCTPISEGCQNCYAKRIANRLRGRCGYPKDEPFRVTLHPERLDEPLKWKKSRKIFVCSMSDLFHEDVPFEFIDHIFAVMGRSQQHTFMLLTKRPERMRDYLQAGRYQEILNIAYRLKFRPEGMGKGIDNPNDMRWWHNVWVGVTVENQEQADKRIPILLQIPAAVRFVSVEPMLGQIDLFKTQALSGGIVNEIEFAAHGNIDWIICGGETGPGARPMHPDWVRTLRDQCQVAGVPFFFKQWGEWSREPESNPNRPLQPHQVCWMNQNGVVSPVGKGTMPKGAILMSRVGKKNAGRLLDGRTWEEFPV